jgi:hypothetical protein
VQTVIETNAYLAAAKAAGMSDEEREELVTYLAKNPDAGEIMVGTGGCRKLRWKRPRTGRSGGYRVVSYYGGTEVPLFLLTVFAKTERANLSRAERNALRGLTATLETSLRKTE